MSPLRKSILNLEANQITKVAMLGLGDPAVIPLWFGESDLVTPSFIREAAKQALDEGRTFYTTARGILPLRQAIQGFHERTAGAKVELERITVPGSAMLAVIAALQCVVETGDNIVCVSPVWTNIVHAAQITGAEVRFARLEENWNASPPCWRLDIDRLFALCDARTKALFIASPGNPTGWIMSRQEQQAVLERARERGIAIISDEVYGTLVYDGSAHAPSFLQIAEPDDNVFVINSFSKPWAMTGWRIGWLVHPNTLDKQMHVISATDNTGATTFTQWGALAALSAEGDLFRTKMLDRCRAGRDVTEAWVAKQNRIRWMKPEGAFYGFLRVDGLKNSLDFACGLVHSAGVGVAPGSAFGASDDEASDSYVRICFAQDQKLLEEGLARLGRAVSQQ